MSKQTHADRLAARLRATAKLGRDTCELTDSEVRLMRAAANLLLVQAALLDRKVRQARILSRRLAVAREDLHQLRRDRNHLRRRLARPAVVTEGRFTGRWPGEEECRGK